MCAELFFKGWRSSSTNPQSNTPLKKASLAIGASLCAALMLSSAPSGSGQILNTQQISQLSLGNDSSTHDLWAENNFIYVARGQYGLDIIDATNQQAPTVVHTIRPFQGVANIDIEDVHVHNGIAYFTNHVPNGSPTPHVGLFIYDVSIPTAPVELGRLEWGAGPWYHLGGNCHGVYIHDDGTNVFAYLASRTTSAVEVFDVSVPSSPVWLSTIYPPLTQYGTIPGMAHEITVRGNLCFTTWLDAGFAIHDISNPVAPQLVSHTPYSGAYTYHAWPTDDGTHLLTTDAWGNIGLQIWDITTPSAPSLKGTWNSGSGSIMHNVFVKGNKAYLSHFEDGLHIIDISDLSNPVQTGWFDTDLGANGFNTNGTYGVYPFETNIYLSHREDGLYIIGEANVPAGPDTVDIVSANWYRNQGKTLEIIATSSHSPAAVLTVDGFGTMTYRPGNDDYILSVYSRKKPRTITVESNLDGSDSSRVRAIR